MTAEETTAPVAESAADEGASLRRVARGFTVLALATTATQAIGFVALAVAARRLGPENLGAFSFAQSLAVYFAIPMDFGSRAS